jgi:hypothetical protein
MTNYPHAESKKLYEQDALETDKPWERREFSWSDSEHWCSMRREPSWFPEFMYRRRTTLNINGHEVPMPLYAKPEGVGAVYAPIFHLSHLYVAMRVWAVPDDDWRLGIYHLTAEAAVLHAKAILSFSERKQI